MVQLSSQGGKLAQQLTTHVMMSSFFLVTMNERVNVTANGADNRPLVLVSISFPSLHSITCKQQKYSWKSSRVPLYHIYIAADCPNLESPENGEVVLSGRFIMDNATYTCSDGFELIGSSTRICLATGMWSGNAPECSSKRT